MSNNRDLLKEAIADAKVLKETAIANAKKALEESFTPHLKSMLSAKLEEMEREEEAMAELEENQEELDEMDAPSFQRKSGASLDPSPKKVGQTTVQEEEEDEELNLEEILKEIEEDDLEEAKKSDDKESDDKKSNDKKEDDKKAEDKESEEEPEEKEGDEEKPEGDEDEEIDLENMTEDDLKNFVEDVIADMVASGELENLEGETEGEEGEDFSFTDDLPSGELGSEEGEEELTLEPTAPMMEYQKEPSDAAAAGFENIVSGLKSLVKKGGEIGKKAMDALEVLGSAAGAAIRNEAEIEAEVEELQELLKEYKKENKEVNLLNSKLLYSIKLFSSKKLNEGQVKTILKAFDGAKTLNEVKLIYGMINDNLITEVKRPTQTLQKRKSFRNPSTGGASRPSGIIKEHRNTIVDNVDPMEEIKKRWAKIAGLDKNE